MERILDRENLRSAWRQVKSNRGGPGVDGMTIDEFPSFARSSWPEIRQALLDGSYQPLPVLRHRIPKPKGGERLLGVPSVVDRVIQQAIAQLLVPTFDPEFSESSFGFRPKRSAHGAVRLVRQKIREGYSVAVDLDLEKFFDRVDHDLLMVLVARKVRDRRLLALIGRYLRAGVLDGEELRPTAEGTPQGSPLSPLLANILLDQLDKELERRGHVFARYADDLRILVRSLRAGQRVKASVTRFLRRRLRLEVNEQKSRVCQAEELEFLGFVFRGGRIVWSKDSFEHFQYRVRRLTNRSWGVSMDERLQRLSLFVRGWMNYFGVSEYYRPIPEIDKWVRRRVRMCYWKQWRRPRTKIRNLLRLGTGRRQAISTGLGSKSYWHLSRTLATQSAMTNQWLKQQGLVSVRDLWIALAPRR